MHASSKLLRAGVTIATRLLLSDGNGCMRLTAVFPVAIRLDISSEGLLPFAAIGSFKHRYKQQRLVFLEAFLRSD